MRTNLHVIVPIEGLAAYGTSKLHRPHKNLSRCWYPKPTLCVKRTTMEAFLHGFLFLRVKNHLLSIRITRVRQTNVQGNSNFLNLLLFDCVTLLLESNILLFQGFGLSKPA